MSTQKITEFGAEKFIQELLRSKEAKPLEDFDKAWIISTKDLKKRDYDMLYQRYFGLDNKLTSYRIIGEMHGISASRANDIIDRAIRFLRIKPRVYLFTEGVEYIEKLAFPYKQRIENCESPETVYNIQLRDTEMHSTTCSILNHEGIHTLYQLSRITIKDLLHIRKLGEVSVNGIINICKQYGIELVDDRDEPTKQDLEISIIGMSHDAVGELDFRDLPVSNRAKNNLIMAKHKLNCNTYTVKEISNHTCKELLSVRNLGQISLDEIRLMWKILGYELREE